MMWELYTVAARQVIVLAQEAARSLGHDYIGTEHLLLGLLLEEEGLAARSLTRSGVTDSDVRLLIVQLIGSGITKVEGQIPFTPRSKTILERAAEKAASLNHNYVGTEHILLGMLRETEGVATRVLLDLGVNVDEIIDDVTGTGRDVGRAFPPNDLLAAPPPAATSQIGHLPATPEEQAKRTETPESEQAGSARRGSAVAFEYGPASSETRRKIEDRCGFRVDGDKVAITDRPAEFLEYIVFLRLTESKETLSPREQGIASVTRNHLSPTSLGVLPYKAQSGAHIVVDESGICGVVRDPLDIDGNDVRPGLIAGFAVGYRDIAAIDVEFCEVDSPVHRDELHRERDRPQNITPKSAFQLVLRGNSNPDRSPFTIEMELDELRRTRWRKVKKEEVAALSRRIGSMWARFHLERDDLTDDQRARLTRVQAGKWDHVVTWMRAGDSGSFVEGSEDDLVHTEWLLASLEPPINGTLGFAKSP